MSQLLFVSDDRSEDSTLVSRLSTMGFTVSQAFPDREQIAEALTR